ncbi:glycosyltransferase [Oscillatoria sp. CS-180]|uniref:glycosyltransferase n=1 Tax=Oscillatoria sp. CS-180 TaxID=3021720 RepID=UPI00232D2BB7|nr:glycosyltransferase [Oscillatoria sp. CS-180]MDB9526182.1 glycosyltransferase [Oscillatoria sp. CS-180]
MTSVQIKQRSFRPQLATLLMIGTLALAACVALAWFAGNGLITTIFQQLDHLQQHPPGWAMTPMMLGNYFLFWAASLMALVWVVMRISPTPQTWSRTLVILILGVLTIRYLFWRTTATLNLSTPLDGVFSLGLFALELLILTSGMVQLFLLLRVRDRRKAADQLAQTVLDGSYQPTVGVLIPTYDEPEFILRRTVIGCQAMEYGPKTIYLLDDTRRPAIKALAKELGCEYITRPDNRHAKAGNLNHAIPQTQGELLVLFDADFVPTRNFLTRTIGFFQDPKVALVQTPQSFYNPDPIARNLGLEDVLTPEEEVFYRQIQRVRDGAGAVVCAGTSFVVRRTALEDIGGFVTEAVSEDFFTGIQLAAKGYRLVYLNEKLSAGLAAENIATHALQRVRWEQGTLQAFFIQSNPVTIPGLKPIQRLAYFEGLIHWFSSIARVGFLLMPLAYAFLGIIPLRATESELVYFFLPFYLVQLSVFSWLNYRSRSALLSDVYSLVLAFPLALTVFQVMLRPFSKGFKVTPKGTASDRYHFNWSLAWPLVIVFGLTALSLWVNLGHCLVTMASPAEHLRGIGIGWLWSTYNLIMLGLALLILLDAPRPSPYEWFKIQRVAQLNFTSPQGQTTTLWGTTTMISEVAAAVSLTKSRDLPFKSGSPQAVELVLADEQLTLPGTITSTRLEEGVPTFTIEFAPLSLPQQRQLVEMLFCRPGQWQSRCSPNELQSLWLIIKSVMRPRFLVERQPQPKPVLVSRG